VLSPGIYLKAGIKDHAKVHTVRSLSNIDPPDHENGHGWNGHQTQQESCSPKVAALGRWFKHVMRSAGSKAYTMLLAFVIP